MKLAFLRWLTAYEQSRRPFSSTQLVPEFTASIVLLKLRVTCKKVHKTISDFQESISNEDYNYLPTASRSEVIPRERHNNLRFNPARPCASIIISGFFSKDLKYYRYDAKWVASTWAKTLHSTMTSLMDLSIEVDWFYRRMCYRVPGLAWHGWRQCPKGRAERGVTSRVLPDQPEMITLCLCTSTFSCRFKKKFHRWF